MSCLSRAARVGALLMLVHAARLGAQSTTAHDSVSRLDRVRIVAERAPVASLTPLQLATLPVAATVVAPRVLESINVVDAEDAVKYQPSLFLRKRNNGDTQAVMGTRVWGVSSSARSLVFADGVPLSALIANNNSIGGPRWGLVAPVEIARVDVMYGPFSAAYAGNSMGAVLEMTTRMPTRFTGQVDQTLSQQRYRLYGTDRRFGMSQTSLSVGDRLGKFAFWISGNYQDGDAQPLAYVTASTFPSGTTGGYAAQNKLGKAANVLGASGLLHTGMMNAKVKLAYDLTPRLRAAYTLGAWQNSATSDAETYLMKSGTGTYAAQGGFASGTYALDQRHTMQSLSLRTDSPGDWNWEAVATRYAFDHDQQRSPTSSSANGETFGQAGRAAVLDGTGWSTLDAKLVWRRGGIAARHSVAAGVHRDTYTLASTTYSTAEWTGGSFDSVASAGSGHTSTTAFWLQDAWRFRPSLTATLGLRAEWWRAADGRNANGSTVVRQPTRDMTRLSPKARLVWTAGPATTLTASLGRAYRFATVSELYQLVTTGPTFTSPNPDLRPDNVLAAEVRAERRFDRGRVQVALFQDDIRDAMIAQFLPLVPNSPTLYSYVSNVRHVRARGIELSASEHSVGITNLELSGSVTYVDPRIIAIDGRATATAPTGSADGKMLPNIPDWRMTAVATYRTGGRASFTVAGRYSGRIYTTLDNTDVNPNVYQGFSAWFVADAKAVYRLGYGLTAALGVDNVLDRKYFLFHPFPQRTLVGSVTYAF